MSTFQDTLNLSMRNKSRRDFPARDTPRVRHDAIFPDFEPKYAVDFSSDNLAEEDIASTIIEPSP